MGTSLQEARRHPEWNATVDRELTLLLQVRLNPTRIEDPYIRETIYEASKKEAYEKAVEIILHSPATRDCFLDVTAEEEENESREIQHDNTEQAQHPVHSMHQPSRDDHGHDDYTAYNGDLHHRNNDHGGDHEQADDDEQGDEDMQSDRNVQSGSEHDRDEDDEDQEEGRNGKGRKTATGRKKPYHTKPWKKARVRKGKLGPATPQIQVLINNKKAFKTVPEDDPLDFTKGLMPNKYQSAGRKISSRRSERPPWKGYARE